MYGFYGYPFLLDKFGGGVNGGIKLSMIRAIWSFQIYKKMGEKKVTSYYLWILKFMCY